MNAKTTITRQLNGFTLFVTVEPDAGPQNRWTWKLVIPAKCPTRSGLTSYDYVGRAASVQACQIDALKFVHFHEHRQDRKRSAARPPQVEAGDVQHFLDGV